MPSLHPSRPPRARLSHRAAVLFLIAILATACASLSAQVLIPSPPAAPPASPIEHSPLASLRPPALQEPLPAAPAIPSSREESPAAPGLGLVFQTPTPTPRRASSYAARKGLECPNQIEWSSSQPWDDIWYGDSGRPRVAITFDTGKGTPVVLQILETLQAKEVHATFFLMGSWVKGNPEVVRQIVARGHNLGNHSYTHADFRTIPDEQIDWELLATEHEVNVATGCSTRPFLRAPFGSTDGRVRGRHTALGFRDIMWTVDSADWRGLSASDIQSLILSRARNGAILIFHSSVPETALALPGVIDGLRERGFQLVTLTDLLQVPPPPPRGPTPRPSQMGE